MVKIVDDTAFIVIDKSIYNIRKGIHRGLLDVSPMIVRDARRRITEPPKTGRLYFRNGSIHQASAPGESPANLTGDLRDSIYAETTSPYRLQLIADENYAPHAIWMEFGTEDGRIAPRPFIRPTGKAMAREVVQAIQRGVERHLGDR